MAAVALGACVVEKHFTLARADGGVDSTFSMEPEEMTRLVEDSEKAWRALGRVHYGPTAAERASTIFRRSIYAVADIAAGAVGRFERLQGRGGLWITGASASHEAVDNIVDYNHRLADRMEMAFEGRDPSSPEAFEELAERYRFSPDARDAFKDYIETRMTQPHFANARSVRNALDRMRLRQASRHHRPAPARVDHHEVIARAVHFHERKAGLRLGIHHAPAYTPGGQDSPEPHDFALDPRPRLA